MSFLPVSSPGGGILCFRNLGPLLWSLIHKNLDLRQRNCFLAPRQQKELLRVLCGASRPQQVVLFVLFLAFCQDRSSSSNAAVVSLRSSRDIIIPSSMTKVLIWWRSFYFFGICGHSLPWIRGRRIEDHHPPDEERIPRIQNERVFALPTQSPQEEPFFSSHSFCLLPYKVVWWDSWRMGTQKVKSKIYASDLILVFLRLKIQQSCFW